MRFDGTLKSWNDERGFGFVEPRQGGQDLFVHIKSFPAGSGRPTVGLPLSFEVELGPDGKKRAKAVEFSRQCKKPMPQYTVATASWTISRVLVIPVFALLYWYVVSHYSFNPIIALIYLVASIVAFLAYALDKSAAKQGKRRISESSLHVLGLACGWPGALLAQQLLRHKTSKPSFVSAFWATVVINSVGFFAAHSPLAAGLRM